MSPFGQGLGLCIHSSDSLTQNSLTAWEITVERMNGHRSYDYVKYIILFWYQFYLNKAVRKKKKNECRKELEGFILW